MLQSNITSHLYGFTDLKSLNERGPLVISYGKGIYVYDTKDNKYLDANSGLWNVCAGFDHPGLIEVAKKQYEKFAGYHSLFGRLSEETLKLSDKLIEVSPFEQGRVFFCNSGSEANDTMIKMLWMFNPELVSQIKKNYNTYKWLSWRNSGCFINDWKPYNKEFGLPLKEFIHADCPHFWKFGLENESEDEFSKRMARNLENLILKEDPETIAGFVAEPVQGAGGVIPPSKII